MSENDWITKLLQNDSYVSTSHDISSPENHNEIIEYKNGEKEKEMSKIKQKKTNCEGIRSQKTKTKQTQTKEGRVVKEGRIVKEGRTTKKKNSDSQTTTGKSKKSKLEANLKARPVSSSTTIRKKLDNDECLSIFMNDVTMYNHFYGS